MDGCLRGRNPWNDDRFVKLEVDYIFRPLDIFWQIPRIFFPRFKPRTRSLSATKRPRNIGNWILADRVGRFVTGFSTACLAQYGISRADFSDWMKSSGIERFFKKERSIDNARNTVKGLIYTIHQISFRPTNDFLPFYLFVGFRVNKELNL